MHNSSRQDFHEMSSNESNKNSSLIVGVTFTSLSLAIGQNHSSTGSFEKIV
jgi:hypothetical protein